MDRMFITKWNTIPWIPKKSSVDGFPKHCQSSSPLHIPIETFPAFCAREFVFNLLPDHDTYAKFNQGSSWESNCLLDLKYRCSERNVPGFPLLFALRWSKVLGTEMKRPAFWGKPKSWEILVLTSHVWHRWVCDTYIQTQTFAKEYN